MRSWLPVLSAGLLFMGCNRPEPLPDVHDKDWTTEDTASFDETDTDDAPPVRDTDPRDDTDPIVDTPDSDTPVDTDQATDTDSTPPWDSDTANTEDSAVDPDTSLQDTAGPTLLPDTSVDADDSATDTDQDSAADTHWDTAPAAETAGPVDAPPRAEDDRRALDEDSAHSWTLQASDPEGAALTWQIVTSPAHGTLQGTAPHLTYTPGPDFHGPDALTFRVSDGTSWSREATVVLDVQPVDDAPVARPLTVQLDEDSSITLDLPADDPDGDTLTATLVSTSDHGVVTLDGLSLTYTPGLNFHGDDFVRFRISDGTTPDWARVSFEVMPVNDSPILFDARVTLNEDSSAVIQVFGQDADGDSLTYVATTTPPHLELTPLADGWSLVPEPDWNGESSFIVRGTDPDGAWDEALVSITVRPVNDPPTARPTSLFTLGNVALPVSPTEGPLANAADPDGDALTLQPGIIPTALGGSMQVSADGSMRYRPPVGVGHEVDQVTLTVVDADGAMTPAPVDLTLGERVWFVDSRSGGVGSSWSPFATLAEAVAASGPDETLVLSSGDASPYQGGIALQPGQRLVGSVTAVVVDGSRVWPAESRPTITSSIHGLQGAGSALIQGITLSDVAGPGIQVGNADDFRIVDVTMTSISGPGVLAWDCTDLRLTDVAITTVADSGVQISDSRDLTLTRVSVTDASGFGIWLDQVEGLIQLEDLDLQHPVSGGVFVDHSGLQTGDTVQLTMRDSLVRSDPTVPGRGGWGVEVQLGGAAGANVHIELIDNVIQDTVSGGFGIYVHDQLGGAGAPVRIDLRRNRIEGTRQTGVKVEGQDQAVIRLTAEGDLVRQQADGEPAPYGDVDNLPEAFDVDARDDSAVYAELSELDLLAEEISLEFNADDRALVVARVLSGRTEGPDRAVSARVRDSGTVHLTTQGLVAVGPVQTDLQGTSRSTAELYLHLSETEASRFVLDDGRDADLFLAGPSSALGWQQHTDAGALLALGNLSAGNTPTVLVPDWLYVVTPNTVLLP